MAAKTSSAEIQKIVLENRMNGDDADSKIVGNYYFNTTISNSDVN